MKYLDETGLKTLVTSIDNTYRRNGVLQIYNAASSSLYPSSINTTVTVSSGYTLIYFGTLDTILAIRGTAAYTHWSASNGYSDYTAYGTYTAKGVTPKGNTLFFALYSSQLYCYTTSMNLINAENPIKWTTVAITNSPFTNPTGFVTTVQRRENQDGDYVWKITITNNDGEEQEYDIWSSTAMKTILWPGPTLADGKTGTMTITLSKNVKTGSLPISY